MPPQSRSSTCATCQKRKVKCDRLRPACSQCVKYKWVCPGYATTPKSQSHGGRDSLVSNERSRNSNAIAIPQRPQAILSKRPDALSKPHRPPIAPAISIHFPPASESFRLATLLVHHISSNTPTSPFKRLGPFIDFVPTRIGLNRALDDAVQLICSAGQIPEAFSPGNSPSDNFERYRCEYYKALKSLRLSLQDEREALSSEVLCATVLLSWYEAYANAKDDRWLTHTGGCSQLIQLRGPSRHVQGFDRALLHGQQPLIVSEALIRQKSCFLDDPSWREVLNTPVDGKNPDPDMPLLIASNSSLATLASFRKDVYAFKDIKHPDQRQASLRQLLSRADKQREELKGWLSFGRMVANGVSARDELSVLFTKNALTLICVDAVLLDLYEASGDVPEDQVMANLKPLPEALHIEVIDTFKDVFVSLEVANKVMPVETAQLLLVVRKLSSDMLSTYGHPKHKHLWARLAQTVDEIDKNPSGFVYENCNTWMP